MADFWMSGGKLVTDASGKPILCANCPCNTIVCGSCAASPLKWRLTTGNDFTNDGCTNCALLNNLNIILQYLPPGQGNHGTEVSNGCYWESGLSDGTTPWLEGSGSTGDPAHFPCQAGGFAGPAFWELRYLTGITFTWELQLKVGASSILEFSAIPFGNFNCLSANTFTAPTFSVGTCASSGSSATITPA